MTTTLVEVNTKRREPIAIIITATMSLLIAFVAIFGLSAWAETSGLHHGVQHVLIFSAGTGFGSALLKSIRTRRGGSQW